jgi:hypothetical protein
VTKLLAGSRFRNSAPPLCDKQTVVTQSSPPFLYNLIMTSDIITSHGRCLLPTANTPVIPRGVDQDFYEDLVSRLYRLQDQDLVRQELYGDDAQGSRYGHTPPGVRERYQSVSDASKREFMNRLEPPTPETPVLPLTPLDFGRPSIFRKAIIGSVDSHTTTPHELPSSKLCFDACDACASMHTLGPATFRTLDSNEDDGHVAISSRKVLLTTAIPTTALHLKRTSKKRRYDREEEVNSEQHLHRPVKRKRERADETSNVGV